MAPTSGIFAADDLLSEEPKNNTIPLWGPSWCKDAVTWRIDNFDKITESAQDEMLAGIETWAHNHPEGFTLTQVADGETPDMTIKFKKGGGRVQGHALQQSDSGCFTSVKISVSGKAFGQDSPMGQVESITIQEVGHGLGLLHSDNTNDVMYGQVQSPPNVNLSACDLEAWNAVQDPNDTRTEVFCNPTDPGEGPGPANPTTIDITNSHDHENQREDDSYSNRDTVHIFVNTDVSGASVHVEIAAPKSTLSGDTTTNDSGQAHIHYKVNAGRDGKGDYHIFTTVTNNGETLSCEHPDTNDCLAHFSVS